MNKCILSHKLFFFWRRFQETVILVTGTLDNLKDVDNSQDVDDS